MDLQQLSLIVSRLEQTVADLKLLLNANTDHKSTPAKQLKSRSTSTKAPNLSAFSVSASELGPMPDYKSADWPEAIDPKMIIKKDNKAEQKFRALQIINHIREPLKDKKVLDFGCGNGYVAAEASHTAQLSVGYDIQEDSMWADHKSDNLKLTTSLDTVKENGPYDLIIMYDVLDHIVAAAPTDVVKSASELLSEQGVLFIRTHPWTSRTGGHIYEQYNKAYIHLIMTPDEMAKEGIEIEPNSKIIRPMAAYELWFSEANLSVVDRKSKTNLVENHFVDSIMDRIVKINWGNKIDNDTARKIMGNHFIDYKLKRSK